LGAVLAALALLGTCVALANTPAVGEFGRRVVSAPVLFIVNPIGRAARALWGAESVWIENRRLKADVARLRANDIAAHEMAQENARYRALLTFRSRTAYQLLPAQVIGRSADRAAGTALIDRGTAEGVTVGLTCLSLDGLAGKVIRAGQHTAVVRTLEEEDSPVSAFDQRTRVEGIVVWRAGPPSHFELQDVPAQAEVAVGDPLLSTGYGGVFPRGLRVGTVTRVGIEQGGLVKHIELQSSARFERLEDLLVLMNAPAPGDSLNALWLDVFPSEEMPSPRLAGPVP
jgi:rod shape-determining protein MreC